MSKDELSLSVNVNGQSKVPPGFRFHPTEEELLQYYLRKKVAYEKIDLDVIRDIDLNKLEPWDIKEKCKIGSTPQNDWYFFSHKDKKYPTGTRTNRATAAGFWKATGRDKVICSSLKRIGMRKTLVFYKGRAPHGQKSDWIMHEYRLDDNTLTSQDYGLGSSLCDSSQEDGWVVCRVFKKKKYHKAVVSPQRSSSAASIDSTAQMQSVKKDASVHDQFLAYINGTKSCKQETDSLANITTTTTDDYNPMQQFINPINWSDMDRLVASQLNGQPRSSRQMYACYHEPNEDICFPLDNHDHQTLPQGPQPSSMAKPNETACYTSEIDIWSFAQSSSQSSSPDPFYHLSV